MKLVNHFHLFGSEGKGVETVRTHIRRENVGIVLCKDAEIIGEVLVPYTFRHRYAKPSHAAGIRLTNIAVAMAHTAEVPHKSYERFMQDGKAYLYVEKNARFS